MAIKQKTTAAKTASKTTTAKTKATTPKTIAKPSKKKATTAEPTEKAGGEITVTGNKLMKTIQTQFSKKFEYLLLCFIIDADREKTCNVKCIDTSKTISAARKKASNKELSMHGRSKVQSIEDFFWKELGIACQIGISNYSGHLLYFPLGSFNEKTISQANEWAKNAGCNKISADLIQKASTGYVF